MSAALAHVPTVERPQPHFPGKEAFRDELTNRVARYFADRGLRRRDSAAFYLKAAFILAWFWGSWAALVFGGLGFAADLAFAASLALAAAAIGFNIQHDANHGSASASPLVNRLLGCTLDMIGGSSWVWRFKHNVFHHSFCNIVGADTDISAEPLLRLAPGQQRRPAHRFQAFYIWGLYALLPVGWELMDDWRDLLRGRIGTQSFPRPKGKEVAILVAGKVFFFCWAFVLPMMLHPVAAVIFFFLFANAVLGIVLSTTFQLAHCVNEVEFPEMHAGAPMEFGWAEHQVRTTANFARRNRLVTWFVGGLNFQIEHHLFSKISHVHYPALSSIVEETCREYGIPYHSHESLGAAIGSHVRLLRTLGAA